MRGSLATFMQTDGAAEGGAGGVGLCAIEAAASASTVLGQPPNMSSQLVLKPYQLLGLNWLGALHANGLNGILADEMGLGKTVQLISLLAHLTHEAAQRGERAGPFLIITPTSTAENWARELAVWCPALVCAKYVGSEAERAQLREELREGHWDVLVTTYSLFERDSAAARDERSFLNKQRFEYAILDEAHCIKNAASARFRNLCRLSARRRVLLTGTPLENNLRELYTLLSFLMPALIGPAERDQLIAESARGASASLDAARRVMAPFVLRRLKSQVLTQLLLPKTERVEALRMDEPHARAYHAVLSAHAARVEAARAAAAAAAGGGGGGATGDAELDELIADAGQPLGSRRGEGREADGGGRARVQAALADKRWAKHAFTELRKAAQHPLLVRARYDGAALAKIAEVLWRSGHFGEDASHERVAEEVATLSDYRLHQLCAEHKLLHDFRLPDDALASSAKVRFLRALLPRLKAEGHRVVIFSQWTSVLDLLETLLLPGPAGLDLPYVRFDGSTSADDRQLLIDQFSSSDEVFAFLLTTRAGGVGINLTAADTVILHDVDFNPAIDRQVRAGGGGGGSAGATGRGPAPRPLRLRPARAAHPCRARAPPSLCARRTSSGARPSAPHRAGASSHHLQAGDRGHRGREDHGAAEPQGRHERPHPRGRGETPTSARASRARRLRARGRARRGASARAGSHRACAAAPCATPHPPPRAFGTGSFRVDRRVVRFRLDPLRSLARADQPGGQGGRR
jgi:SWI/SNF-related matrix-associated actin-dependent regulator 1 of chromatin subfamily A